MAMMVAHKFLSLASYSTSHPLALSKVFGSPFCWLLQSSRVVDSRLQCFAITLRLPDSLLLRSDHMMKMQRKTVLVFRVHGD